MIFVIFLSRFCNKNLKSFVLKWDRKILEIQEKMFRRPYR